MAEEWKYAPCIECGRELHKTTMFGIEGTYICNSCVMQHNGRGKYEAYAISDPDADEWDYWPLATALILEHWASNSDEDERMYAEGWGYCGMFGKYLLMEDNYGFVTYEEYDTVEKTRERFDALYKDGWGASDDDAYISFDRGKPYVSFDGKELNIWTNRFEEINERRCIARIRLESMKTGFYPNLWIVGERGDMRLVSY